MRQDTVLFADLLAIGGVCVCVFLACSILPTAAHEGGRLDVDMHSKEPCNGYGTSGTRTPDLSPLTHKAIITASPLCSACGTHPQPGARGRPALCLAGRVRSASEYVVFASLRLPIRETGRRVHRDIGCKLARFRLGRGLPWFTSIGNALRRHS